MEAVLIDSFKTELDLNRQTSGNLQTMCTRISMSPDRRRCGTNGVLRWMVLRN